MRINRALWIENFEDGTFEDYWSVTVSGGTASISLQDGWMIKDGNYCIRLDFNLASSNNAKAIKTWTSPQIDLTDYDQIFFWSRTSETGTPKVAIRNNTAWGNNLTGQSGTYDEWTLNWVTLSGTRDLVDGIWFEFDDTNYGTSDVTAWLDTIVAIRTDTDHEFIFDNQLEQRFVKTLTADLNVKKLPGAGVTTISDRGKQSRQRTLTGGYLTTSDINDFDRMFRSGDNLYLLRGLSNHHGVVMRLAGRSVGQVAGKPAIFPFTMAFVESLESSL